MNKSLRVLLVEDSEDDALLLARTLRQGGFEVVDARVDTAEAMTAALSRQPWDVILSDHAMPRFSAPAALEVLRRSGLDVPFIIVSGALGEETAVGLMKAGAADFIVKGKLARLVPCVERELAEAEQRRARRRADEELRFQKALLECQSEAAPDGILVVSPERMVLAHNRRFVEMWHIPEEVIASRSDARVFEVMLRQIAHPQRFLERVNHLLTRPDMHCHEEMTLLDGRTLDRYCSPILDPSGAYLGRVWYFRDITERKQAEEALHAQQEQIRLLLDSTAEAIFGMDLAGNCTFCNRTCARVLGYSHVRDLLGRNMHDLIHHTRFDGRPCTQEDCRILSHAQRGQGIHRDDDVFWRTDGTSFPVEYWSYPVRSDGHIGGVVMTFMDITQRKQAEEALHTSEEKLRTISEAALDAVIMIDSRGMVMHWNPAAERIFGFAGREILGQNVHHVLTPPRYQARFEAGMEQFARTGQGPVIGKVQELEALRKDGSLFPIELTVSAIQMEGQWCAVGICRDITERKRTEQQLRLQTSGLEAADNGIAITDRDGAILWTNPAFSRLTGYAFEEVLGRNPRLLKSGRQNPAFYEKLWKTILSGQVWRGELVNQRKDGTLYDEEMTITPVRDAGGDISRFIAVKQDVTARKQAEQRLREQADLLDKATDAIFIVDLEGTIRFWNQGAERVYGWTAAEALDQKTHSLLYRGTPAELESAIQCVLTKGNWHGELYEHTRDGRSIIVESRWTLVRDTSGQPHTVLVINSDVTEKKRLENQFQRVQRMESIGTLAGGIAHDLNNVLTPILLAAGMLPQIQNEEDRLSLLNTLRVSAERGADLVKQILSFARGTIGERVPLQLQPIIKETHKILEHTLPKNIEVKMLFPNDLWWVMGDGTGIAQILMNLCVNARDAMPRGGLMTIRAENVTLDEHYARMNIEAQPGPYVRLEVADTGTGIAPEIRDKIFDPFFTTKEQGKGTGLGLSTVLGITKSHGGFVSLHSEVGKGSQFAIHLPALPAGRAGTTEVKPPQRLLGHGEHILVVDDEEAIRDITCMTLNTHGYQVLTAEDGSDAVAQFARHIGDIQLVIVDMMMPIMDGAATMRALQKIDPRVRIIASSGRESGEWRADGPGLGEHSFLKKPFTAETLLTTVREVLDAT